MQYIWFPSAVFKTWSSRSERFTSVFYSDGVLGSAEEVSLKLAWEIHNHWSHCWALIRPAVSSLKGQKSIQLHYHADSVVISTHASSLAHTPKQHTNTLLSMSYGSDVCLLLLMWWRSDGLYCDMKLFLRKNAIPFFFFFLLKSNKQPSVLLEAPYGLQVMNYEPILFFFLSVFLTY